MSKTLYCILETLLTLDFDSIFETTEQEFTHTQLQFLFGANKFEMPH